MSEMKASNQFSFAILTAAGERETDKNDHRTDDDRRKQRVEQLTPLPLDEGRHEEIDQCDTRDASNGTRHAPLLGGRNDRCDEGEATAEVDGHLALGDQMEDKCADTSREERGSRVETNEQWYQYRRAKGYKKELYANNGLAGSRKFLSHMLRD